MVAAGQSVTAHSPGFSDGAGSARQDLPLVPVSPLVIPGATQQLRVAQLSFLAAVEVRRPHTP